jgi:integrase
MADDSRSSRTTNPDSRKAVAVEGHPGIFQKGSRYQVRYRHDGRQVAKSFRTLTEAKRFRGKVETGDARPTSSEPFRTYALRWLDTYTGRTAKGLSASTRASYRDAITRRAVPYFGTAKLDRLDAPKVRDYIRHLAKQGHSPATVRRYYAPVRALLATAYEDGLLRSNPAAGVRVIVKDTRARTPRWLTTEQTRALLKATPERHRDLVYFLAATGCRISEALSIRWADYGTDADGLTITIRHSKTEAGLRTITVPAQLARRLNRRRSEARFAGDEDLMFGSVTGTAQDAHNWRRRVFNRAAKDAGVPWATPHKLRHGLASMMAEQGHSPARIAAQLGHADGGVLALRTYVHAERLVETEFIDAALGG